MQDVTKGTLIRLPIVVVLRIASLHLNFHIVEQSVSPVLRGVLPPVPSLLTSFVSDQGSKSLQVSILFNLFGSLFFPLHYSAFDCIYIAFVPPFVFCFNWWRTFGSLSLVNLYILDAFIIKSCLKIIYWLTDYWHWVICF